MYGVNQSKVIKMIIMSGIAQAAVFPPIHQWIELGLEMAKNYTLTTKQVLTLKGNVAAPLIVDAIREASNIPEHKADVSKTKTKAMKGYENKSNDYISLVNKEWLARPI